MWTYRGQTRPDFAEPVAEGEESVWDYPRPPAVVPASRHVRVECGDRLIASSQAAIRVLETASPPTYYVPPEDVTPTALVRIGGRSICEWKGAASYWALAGDERGEPVAFSYEDPRRGFESLRGYLGFYPGRVACFLDDERVRPQPGGFYAGWITDDIRGPVKGEPGTGHW